MNFSRSNSVKHLKEFTLKHKSTRSRTKINTDIQILKNLQYHFKQNTNINDQILLLIEKLEDLKIYLKKRAVERHNTTLTRHRTDISLLQFQVLLSSHRK